MHPILRGLASVLVLALLAACATMGPPPAPEQVVAARADARWVALLSSDWEKAYEFLSPGFRATTTLDDYRIGMINRQLNWTGAAPARAVCESAEKCAVKVRVDYALIGGLPGVREVKSSAESAETWLKLDGTWFFLPDRSGR
jgi:hypothetical protein